MLPQGYRVVRMATEVHVQRSLRFLCELDATVAALGAGDLSEATVDAYVRSYLECPRSRLYLVVADEPEVVDDGEELAPGEPLLMVVAQRPWIVNRGHLDMIFTVIPHQRLSELTTDHLWPSVTLLMEDLRLSKWPASRAHNTHGLQIL